MIEIDNLLEQSTDEIWNLLDKFRNKNENIDPFSDNTVVFLIKNDSLQNLGILFSKIMGYSYIILENMEDVLKRISEINKSNIILFSEHEQLELKLLQKIIELTIKFGINFGIMTGGDYRTALIFTLKNIEFFFSTNLESYHSFQIVPRRENEKDLNNNIFSMYSKSLEKSDLTKPYSSLLVFGGGRVDQLAIGTRHLLKYDKEEMINGKFIVKPDDLNSELVMINGCVIGVVSPGKYEVEKKDLLSLRLINSKAVSLIAPISTKLSDENELEIADAFLERGVSFGEVARRTNDYCIHNDLTPAYILYGNPRNSFPKRENNQYFFEVIDNCLKIPYNKKEIWYFRSSADDKLFFISAKPFGIDEISYRKNIIPEYFQSVTKMEDNLSRNRKIKHFFPSDNNFKTILNRMIGNVERLEGNLFMFENNTKINNKIFKLIDEYFDFLNDIEIRLLKYWSKNIQSDKYRIYDLHYGTGYREEVSNDEICPTCKEKRVETFKVNSFDKKSGRIVKICPSCSIVDDVVSDDLLVEVISKKKNGNYYELKIEFINKGPQNMTMKRLFCIRGIRETSLSSSIEVFKIKGYDKTVTDIRFSVNKEVLDSDKLYLTCLTATEGSISMFKRPI